MWAAVTFASPLTVSLKQSIPCPAFARAVNVPLPVVFGAVGVSVALSFIPPWAAVRRCAGQVPPVGLTMSRACRMCVWSAARVPTTMRRYGFFLELVAWQTTVFFGLGAFACATASPIVVRRLAATSIANRRFIGSL